MCVPTLSHTKVAGGPYLLGLSYCLVCPIDNRDEEAKAHPSFICSMQERIHRTMGQRDNCDLTETYGTWCNGPAWDKLGWSDNSTGGERPNAAPDDHNTLEPLYAATITLKVSSPAAPACCTRNRLRDRPKHYTNTPPNPLTTCRTYTRLSRPRVGITSTRAAHRRDGGSLV
jgi:hypothetical protein